MEFFFVKSNVYSVPVFSLKQAGRQTHTDRDILYIKIIYIFNINKYKENMKKIMTIIILLFCMYTGNFCTGEILGAKWDNMARVRCHQVAFANSPLPSHNRTTPYSQPPKRKLCGWPRGEPCRQASRWTECRVVAVARGFLFSHPKLLLPLMGWRSWG